MTEQNIQLYYQPAMYLLLLLIIGVILFFLLDKLKDQNRESNLLKKYGANVESEQEKKKILISMWVKHLLKFIALIIISVLALKILKII